MNAAQLVVEMIEIEMRSDVAPDAKRIIRNDRMALQGALGSRPGSPDEAMDLEWRRQRAVRIGTRFAEAQRTLAVWGLAAPTRGEQTMQTQTEIQLLKGRRP